MRFYHSQRRVTNLEGKYVRSTRFASIGSLTSGTVTLPANATVVLDDFGGTTDAVVSQISGGKPTLTQAFDATGAVVAATFDASGNWTFSAAPTAYPVALIYRVQQTLKNFDSDTASIMGVPTVLAPSSFTRYKRTSVAASYQVLITDELVAITSTAAARTMTLPATASMVVGQPIWFKDESLACSVNNITITPTSGLIDGQTSYVMNFDGETAGVYTDGTNWFLV